MAKRASASAIPAGRSPYRWQADLERGEPVRPAARRAGQHAVAAVPEREAAVDGLLVSDLDVAASSRASAFRVLYPWRAPSRHAFPADGAQCELYSPASRKHFGAQRLGNEESEFVLELVEERLDQMNESMLFAANQEAKDPDGKSPSRFAIDTSGGLVDQDRLDADLERQGQGFGFAGSRSRLSSIIFC